MGNKGELRRVVLTELRRVVSKLRSFFLQNCVSEIFRGKGPFYKINVFTIKDLGCGK